MNGSRIYIINENQARQAKEANSFRDYKEGSATSQYKAAIDEAYELAEKTKAKTDSIHHAKIDSLVDAYARRLANNINKQNEIDARMPSMLITGGGNFNTRKKEKQNQARDKNMQEYNEIQELLHKITSVGKAGISSDDPNALVKLEEKVNDLESKQESMKKVNAYYRKHKTLVDCTELSSDEIQEFERSIITETNANGYLRKPYPTYMLTNNNAEIRRLKLRIEKLKEQQDSTFTGWSFNGGSVHVNTENNRLQILFDNKPETDKIQALKRHGFKWAPSQSAWQRQLTDNAIYSAKRLDFIQP